MKKLRGLVLLLMMVLIMPLTAEKASAKTYMTVIIPKGKTVSLGIAKGSKLQKSAWTSSKKSVATVNSYGVVKGKSNGTAIITGKVGNKKRTIRVIVAPKLKSVMLNKTSVNLLKGQTYTLKAKLNPSGAKAAIYWKSNNAKVVSVNSKGVIKGLKPGTATVTVVAGKFKAKCKVTVSAASEKKYKFSGKITDSVDGSPISKATLKFRKGYNNKNGKVYATAKTKSNGSYSVKLAAGQYTIQVSRKSYVTTYINSSCSKKKSYNYLETSISKPVANGRYRVVLTWGSTPRDLDAHLTGPTGYGGEFHVYYRNKNAYRNGQVIANLDVDDTTSYGPETVTINFDVAPTGTYRYYIHDYTNRSYSYSKALAGSRARVIVYKGSRQIASYSVPNKAGTKWHVFDIVNGKIVKRNTMGYEGDSTNFK